MCTIYLFTLIVLFLSLPDIHSMRTLPEYVKVCKYNDDRDKCIQDSIHMLKPHLSRGIPEMHIPSMDPLLLNEAAYKSDNFNLRIYNVKVHKIVDYNVDYVHMDLEKEIFAINISHPIIDGEGNYEVIGKLGSIRLNGNGTFILNIKNVKQQGVTKMTTVKLNKIEHLQIEPFTGQLHFENFSIQLEPITPANPQFTEIINRAFNDNGKELLEDIVNTIYSQVLYTTMRTVCILYPRDTIIPSE